LAIASGIFYWLSLIFSGIATEASLCETEIMPKRAIRIVKHIGSTPVVAACVACKQEFKAPTSSIRSVKEATEAIQKQFDAHKCQTMDSSQ
jgi:hypothetical protein